MLSESLQELLSAYVDGELAPIEYERVMAALRDSAVARDYVKDLRDMSARIKVLPRLAAPKSFSAHYLQHDYRVKRLRRAWRWGAVGAAAAAIITGIGLWMSHPPVVNPQPGPGVVEIAKKDTPKTEDTNVAIAPEPNVRPDTAWMAEVGNQVAIWSKEQAEGIATGARETYDWLAGATTAADARAEAGRKTLLAAPPKAPGNPFHKADIETPLLVTPADFQLQSVQERLGKKGLFEANLLSSDTVTTLSRLTEACKKAGIPLVIDEEVRQRLDKRLPATFMVYLENVSEDTLGKVWSNLDALDHWRDRSNVAAMSCQVINLGRMDNDGRRQLARSLAIDAQKLLSPKPASTAPQQAVVLAHYPNRTLASVSKDVQQALAAQGGPRPDAVSVIFYLRSSK